MSDSSQIEALRYILSDEDERTARLVVTELSADRLRHEEVVRLLAKTPDVLVSRRAKEILHTWGVCLCQESKDVRATNDFSKWLRLEELCWTLAQMETPQCNLDACRKQLDQLADRVDLLAPASASEACFVQAMSEVLGAQEGFHGNVDDYYNPANSYLDQVLTSKRGIPLTLSLIYIFVGQRLGREVYGLNTPGHYLAHYSKIVFDPFFGGKILEREALASRFRSSCKCWEKPASFEATPFDTARRMLMNLTNSYERNGDGTRRDRIVNCLKYLEQHC